MLYARVVLGVGKGVLCREVSLFQRLKCVYLGWEKASHEKCPCQYIIIGGCVCVFQVSGNTYQYKTLSVYYTHKHISVTKFVNSNKQPQTIKLVNICLCII